MLNKSEILKHCLNKVSEQMGDLNSAMAKVKESIEGEDKSSAGDKFETARAMAQKEMELLGHQIQKTSNDFRVLQQINPNLKTESVQLGSVVETNNKILFFANGLGKIQIDDKEVFVISPSSPVGQMLIGQAKGFKYQLAGNEDKIVDLY